MAGSVVSRTMSSRSVPSFADPRFTTDCRFMATSGAGRATRTVTGAALRRASGLRVQPEDAHSSCYILPMVDLVEVARRSDTAVRDARAELVRAVREAARQGLTQKQIAQLIGRSQPEVSRLLRFHGRSPLALRLRRHSREVRHLIDQAGGSNVRVFGSVATGAEHAGSDVDLLFDMGTPMGLIEIGALERRLSELLGASVELVPASALRPDLRDRVLAEAVPL